MTPVVDSAARNDAAIGTNVRTIIDLTIFLNLLQIWEVNY